MSGNDGEQLESRRRPVRPRPFAVELRWTEGATVEACARAMIEVFDWSERYARAVSPRLMDGEVASHPYPSFEIAEMVLLRMHRVLGRLDCPIGTATLAAC